jgi:hypothetical protein
MCVSCLFLVAGPSLSSWGTHMTLYRPPPSARGERRKDEEIAGLHTQKQKKHTRGKGRGQQSSRSLGPSAHTHATQKYKSQAHKS